MRDLIELNSRLCDIIAAEFKGTNEKQASSKGGIVIVGNIKITFTTEKVK